VGRLHSQNFHVLCASKSNVLSLAGTSGKCAFEIETGTSANIISKYLITGLVCASSTSLKIRSSLPIIVLSNDSIHDQI
jgi:hypothetical protein